VDVTLAKTLIAVDFATNPCAKLLGYDTNLISEPLTPDSNSIPPFLVSLIPTTRIVFVLTDAL
jgi:hypothetical protein